MIDKIKLILSVIKKTVDYSKKVITLIGIGLDSWPVWDDDKKDGKFP